LNESLSKSEKEKAHQMMGFFQWCRWPESNWRPSHYECAALPTELQRQRGRDYNLKDRFKQAADDRKASVDRE
jgi:hypothetical protein